MDLLNHNHHTLANPAFGHSRRIVMSKWSIRKQGMTLPELWQKMEEVSTENINYNTDPILGFPGTPPTEVSVMALEMFATAHPNNIGCHTKKKRAERGFQGTQKLERELIYTIATLAGSTNPKVKVDGYICNGGTEGNDHGMWLGRNKLLSTDTKGRYGIAVLTSFLGHYSIEKSFGRLFLNPPGIKEHTFQPLLPNGNGELTASIVEDAIRQSYGNGYRRFLLVLTAGTTNLGSVDRIPEISILLKTLEGELGIATHVHVDAAFGGFVLPFLEPGYPFGFQNAAVDSISIDLHKMGYAPYSSGAFLCRKGILRHTTTDATYLASHEDSTVCGSRAGAVVVASWASINSLGWAGYQKRIQHCLSLRDYLRERLGEFNQREQSPRVKFYPSRMNVLTVWFSKDLAKAIKAKDPIRKNNSIMDRFCIPDDNHFPREPGGAFWNAQSGSNVRVFRFVLMPHVTYDKIDQFVAELKRKLLAQVA
jgi:glutamate/tyrosine decarboxylase-like PLP-dependent enzyme